MFACGRKPTSETAKTQTASSPSQHKVVQVDWPAVIVDLKKQLARNPNSAFLHNQIAVAYNAVGDFPNSDKEIHTAMRLDRDDPSNFYTAFAFYQQRHLKNEQLAVLEKALQIDPGNALGHYEMAGLLEDDKKPTEALAEYETTKRLVDWVKANPDNYKNSAWTYTTRRGAQYDVTWEVTHIDDDLRRVNAEISRSNQAQVR